MLTHGLGLLGLSTGLLFGCGSTDHSTPSSTSGTAGSAGAASAGTAAMTLGGASTSGGASSGGASSGSAGQGPVGGASSAGTASGGSSGGGGAGAGGATSPGCTGPLEEQVGKLCVAKMVAVTGGYSIDATEVTRLQYATWLATAPAPDPTCTPKPTPSYDPDPTCLKTETTTYADPDHIPAICVDWCDAVAYCKGVGKHLCGKIGGGTNPYDKVADASSSEWFNACSSGGVNTYTYGTTRIPTACNGYDNPAPDFTFLPVGSEPMCQSPVDGFKGVFDLNGNVYEWEDSCQGAGAEAVCRVRGGAVVGMIECGFDIVSFKQNHGGDDVGIRCCKD